MAESWVKMIERTLMGIGAHHVGIDGKVDFADLVSVVAESIHFHGIEIDRTEWVENIIDRAGIRGIVS